jgi:hypothetical protein
VEGTNTESIKSLAGNMSKIRNRRCFMAGNWKRRENDSMALECEVED